jgi:DNA-directed RNA polymerase specialized sigma24 family protein
MPLTPEAFGRFLHWLSSDDQEAAHDYLSVRKRLVRFFVHKGCIDPDALFDETVDIVVGKIEECVDCSNPLGYCYGVARNVWRKYMREFKPTGPLDIDPPSIPPAGLEQEQELQCLERCVDRLSPSDREIVTRYHQNHGRNKIDARKTLASELGGQNALRVRVCRIRKSLRDCVVNCVKQSVN